MSRRSNEFAVAILDLPAWADYEALPRGKFKEFTLNRPQDAGMRRANLQNWVGGALVPDFGARGGVCYHGGGEHYAWVDSKISGDAQQGVYVLDCDQRLYVRRCYPVVNHTGVAGKAGGPTDDWGAYLDDGSPQSKHTYNCISYMPSAWGGGPSGSLVRVAHAGGRSTSRDAVGYSALWRFDLSKASHSVDDPSIHKLTGSALYDFGSGPGAMVNDAPMACIDTIRQGWWATHRAGTGRWGGRMAFTSKTGVISAPQGQPLATPWAALHHFPDDDIIVRLTDHRAPRMPPAWRVYLWRAATPSAWVEARLDRQDIDESLSSGDKAYPSMGYMHPRWSSILGCFVGLDHHYPIGQQPTQTIRVWKIKPPAPGRRFADAWQATWELVTAVPGSSTNVFNTLAGNPKGDAGSANGIFGRFVECESLRAFVWTRDINLPGQLVRLEGM